jgi:hypothetical protein
MPENIWLGGSIGTIKSVRAYPTSDMTGVEFSIGLPTALFNFVGWSPDDIVTAWEASTNPDVSAITIENDGGTLVFTAQTAGQNFIITTVIPSGLQFSNSTFQTLTFNPVPTGGTFTITVNGVTSGAITYSTTPATLASNIQTAIAAMAGFGSTDVLVTVLPSPGSYQLDFSHGQFIGTHVDPVTISRTSLTGGNASVLTTVVAAGAVAVTGTSQVSTLSFPAAGTHSEKISEIQTLSSNAGYGSFTITLTAYGTTTKLPYTAGKTDIQTALEAIVGVGNIQVTGGPVYYADTNLNYDITLTFIGTLLGVDMPLMSITTYNSERNEIQQIRMIGAASAGTFTLTYSGQTTSAIAYNADAPTVQAALIALSNIGTADITCSGGPLVPAGSPVTSAITPAGAVVVNDDLTYGGSAYNVNAAPDYLRAKDTGVGSRYYTLIRFKVTGYITAFNLKLTGYLNNVPWSTAKFSIFDVDDGVIPANATDYAAITKYGAANVSGTTTTGSVTTSGGAATAQRTSFDLTTLVNHVRDRAGWIDGNYVVIQMEAYDNTNEIQYVSDKNLMVVLGANSVGSSERPSASQTIKSGAYGPITLNFLAALGATNLTQTTANSASLTGGTVSASTIQDGGAATYTPTLVQDGGTATIANIKGGTFSLTIAGKNVPAIPYNTSAAALVTLINTAFGSTVCSATGGPAPDTPIVITFSGALATQPIVTIFNNALQTSLPGSVTRTILQAGSTPVVPTNVWDLKIAPGTGTLGLTDNAAVVLSFSQTLGSISAPGSITPIGDIRLKISSLIPDKLQTSINEMFAADVCRVTQIGHSEEIARLQLAGSGDFTNIWYIADTYRIVFINDYAANGSLLLGASFRADKALPSLFMNYTAGTTELAGSDAIDDFPETNRVVLGFVAMESSTTPLHYCKVSTVAASPKSNLSWRYKLMRMVGDGSLNSGVVQVPGESTIKFQWQKLVYDATGTPAATTLVESASILWNSPTESIQGILSDMFFGVGNIFVTGSLVNSWQSESLRDAPVTNAYNELRVALGGVLAGLPIDEYDYQLVMVYTDADRPDPGTTPFQKSYIAFGTELTKCLPPYTNRRESISIGQITQVASMKLGCCDLTVSVPPLATYSQIQTLLDSLFPAFTGTMSPYLPRQLAHPIQVSGTDFIDGPMTFEFISGGSQQSTSVGMTVDTVPTGITIGKILPTTPGVLGSAAVDANQLVTLQGAPYSGTFTLTFGGNTIAALAYNVSLAALTSAVTTAGFSSPTITGNADNGFTFIWVGAGGPRAAITSASSLNNANASAKITHEGGKGATIEVKTITAGRGPNYLNDPNNFSLGRVLNTGDTLTVDDSESSILYGLELYSVIEPKTLKAGTTTIFSHKVNDRVFEPGQEVVFRTTGTAPTGMTSATTYIIDTVELGQINTFTLKTLAGVAVAASTPGSGTFTLTIESLTVNVYSHFTGAIGLANTSSLPAAMKARFTAINVGIGTGDGLTLGAFDMLDSAAALTVGDTAIPDDQNFPALTFEVNNVAASLTMYGGYVGLNFYAGQSGVIGPVNQTGGNLAINNTTMNSLKVQEGATIRALNCVLAASNTLNIG